MRILRPVFAASLFLPALAWAASASSPQTGGGSVSFRFISLAPAKELWARTASGKYVGVQAPSTFIGAPVRVAVDGPVGLFTKSAASVRPGEAGYERVTAFSAAPGAPRQLVLLFGDASGGVTAQAIPDNATRFPYGRVLAVNLTGEPLSMNLGGAECSLPAKGAQLCPPPKAASDLGDMAVRITAPSADGPRVVYSTVWPSGAKLRTMAFLFNDASGRLMVRTVEDPEVKELVEAPDEKAAKASAAKGARRS